MHVILRAPSSFTIFLKRHLGCTLWIQSNKHICSRYFSTTDNNEKKSPASKDAQVVVCGGGITGVSVAYHLAKKGLTDVLLLEQGSLSCGTTWHAAGLVGQIKGNSVQGQLARYSANLYESLEEETGLSTGFKRTGAISLASTEDRMVQLKRLVAMSRSEGLECYVLSPSELKYIVPWISVQDILGGIYSPKDGTTDPTNTVMSLARGASINGVMIIEKLGVRRILTRNGRVSGVETEHGQVISCKYFINAAGMWAREVGQMSSPQVTVPLQPNQHHYALFKPMKGLDFNTPYVRDMDHGIYIREWSEGLMCGAFIKNGKPVFLDGKPSKTEYISLPEDRETFEPYFQSFLNRVPSAETLQLMQLFNGPESFTPDMQPIVGEVPEIRNYFVMAGMHSQGVTFGGGLGKYVADWIADGKPSNHLASVDVKRFTPHHNRLKYLQERTTESEGTSYLMLAPKAEFVSGRKLCHTALYDELSKSGAIFGEVMGIERPLYFELKGGDHSRPAHSVWGKPFWFESVLAEYQACMDGVGVLDTSAMAVFELQSAGNECLLLLQQLCTSHITTLPGSFTRSWMLTDDGKLLNDCIVVCLATNRYILLSPARQWTSAKYWLSQHLPEDTSVYLKDLTPGSEDFKCGGYTILSVISSKAESVLHRITKEKHQLTHTCSQNLSLQYGSHGHIMTTSLTGHTGFLMLLPSQIAQTEYKQLMETNQDLGISNVGYYAQTWMQIENMIPSFGIDFDTSNTPTELSLPVDLQKDVEFIGQAALLDHTTTNQLVQLTLDNHDPDTDLWPWGSEPIYHQDKKVGTTTSTAYSPSARNIVCFGMIVKDGDGSSVDSDLYEIDIGGKRCNARLNQIK